jgi:predicted metal-dependent phosphoesterase TrpH/RNAse (barnase) inhibitor barstar
MKLKVTCLVIITCLLFVPFTATEAKHKINIPDILGYKTLKCDFHMHTVFSDGMVWPIVRVDEAEREGLDAIAITDHIEYQPHKKDVPTNHNRPYEIALGRAREKNILLVKATEITRETPPGHFNALFLEDINLVDTEEFIDAVKAANSQGAFVFWNHPGWKPEFKGWFDIHTQLYENLLLQGIEVVNGTTYYPDAHKWALEKNLTMMGNSDIHQPIVCNEMTSEIHRPMTLVFAKEKSVKALKEALIAGRTAVWFENQLIGKPNYLHAIFKKSVNIDKPYLRKGDTIWFEITNNSDIDIQVLNLRQGGQKLELPANAITIVKTKVDGKAEQIELKYKITNFLIAPEKGLPVNLNISLVLRHL